MIEKVLKQIKKNLDTDENIEEGIVTKKVIIDNLPGLIKYLKSCGVDPTIFKSFLSVEKVVSNEKVKELFDQELISYKKLKPCITSQKISKSVKIK